MAIRSTLRGDCQMMINDDPIDFVVKKDVIINKTTGKKVTQESAPYIGTLAEFRVARAYPAVQETGTITQHPFYLLALDIPTGTFVVECEVLIGNRKYRVTDIVSENDDDGITEVALNQVSN